MVGLRFGAILMSREFRRRLRAAGLAPGYLPGIGLSDVVVPFAETPHLTAGLIFRKLLVIRKLRVLL
jgi:hypothetical protein